MMGLDTTHDAWHGAYSAFMHWRIEIAAAAGIPLTLMQGFYVKGKVMDDPFFMEKVQAKGEVDTVYIRQIEKALPIRWDILKPDPLYVLLYHSDCDGQIEVENLEPLAKRLDKIVPLLPDADGGGHIGNWREKTKQFADGCRRAAKAGKPLEFQ